jgi:hypothetical protein
MRDPVAEIAEIARVTRPGGVVAACVWDHGAGRTPLGPFWRVMNELHPGGDEEASLPGAREGHLEELFAAAGLENVTSAVLTAEASHATFEEWWEPFTLGVGPAGGRFKELPPDEQRLLQERLHEQLGSGPFQLAAEAWAARGIAG